MATPQPVADDSSSFHAPQAASHLFGRQTIERRLEDDAHAPPAGGEASCWTRREKPSCPIPGAQSLAVLGHLHLQRAHAVEPGGQSPGEAQGDVLHHEDGEREVRGQLREAVARGGGASGRGGEGGAAQAPLVREAPVLWRGSCRLDALKSRVSTLGYEAGGPVVLIAELKRNRGPERPHPVRDPRRGALPTRRS